jgi:general secretion pathway protein A
MYESHFRLTGPAFQLNPDPSFYFGSKGHSRALSYLKYGVYQGEGFIVITGEIGAGKTTLVRALLNEIDESRVVAAQLVSTQLDVNDLLQAVSVAFGLPIKDVPKAEMLARLEAFLNSLVAEGRRALLIVDEAQHLTPRAMEELRMLSNFHVGGRALLQSFLVGQPELREVMRGPSLTQLRERIIASYHLGPMDRDETRAYIMHRLAHVGWSGDPVLDPAIFPPLHEASGGIPRRINAICNRLLLGTFLKEKHEISLTEVEETLAEMRDEIGPVSGPHAPVLVHDSAAINGNGPARQVPPSAIGARLTRLEKNMETALELLRRLVQRQSITAPTPMSQRQGSGPGTPGTQRHGRISLPRRASVPGETR